MVWRWLAGQVHAALDSVPGSLRSCLLAHLFREEGVLSILQKGKLRLRLLDNVPKVTQLISEIRFSWNPHVSASVWDLLILQVFLSPS